MNPLRATHTAEVSYTHCFVHRLNMHIHTFVVCTYMATEVVCGCQCALCLHILSDPMHSYLGLCGLAIGGEEGLRPAHSCLNISQRAAEWLATLHHRQGGL